MGKRPKVTRNTWKLKVPAEHAEEVAQHADEIRKLGRQTLDNHIEIGRRLFKVKRLVGHRNWLPWLEREFGWTDRTARNYVRAYKLFKQSKLKPENVSDLKLPVSVFYKLGAVNPARSCGRNPRTGQAR